MNDLAQNSNGPWPELEPAAVAVSRRPSPATDLRGLPDPLAIAIAAFENALEGMMVTDAAGHILHVNPAFTRITGYAGEEVLDRTPNLLQSDRHDPGFYRDMWRILATEGRWEGEIWNRRKSGEAYLEQLTITAIRDRDGAVHRYIGVFHDLTANRRGKEQLDYQANHDALTGLPNRALITDFAGQALNYAQRDREGVAVMFVGLDRFKQINESFGHTVGDELLLQTAWRLAATVGEGDMIARFGGDTFVILREGNHEGAGQAARLAHRIMAALAVPFELTAHTAYVTASIGVAVYPDDADDVEQLLRNAEVAMNRAKEAGRNTYELYTPAMNEAVARRLLLENRMRKALEREEFTVHYQPKYRADDRRLVGMEALVRWIDPERGVVSPGDFIPVAEETGLILPLGYRVLREACRQTRRWLDAGHELTIAVNLSARQFRDPDLPAIVAKILEETGLPPTHLELEVTESAVMNDVEEAIRLLHRLRDQGIAISVDDFGTGYSSLSYLKRFPITKLKIDQSFVRDMHANGEDRSIVDAVVSLARSLGLTTVAEGVELEEQLGLLQGLGVDEIQGYLFSPPVDADRFAKLLE